MACDCSCHSGVGERVICVHCWSADRIAAFARMQDALEKATTSTLQLACPTCGGEIEVEYDLHLGWPDCPPEAVSLRTYCFDAISRKQAYDLLMNEGARQAELATERAGERP